MQKEDGFQFQPSDDERSTAGGDWRTANRVWAVDYNWCIVQFRTVGNERGAIGHFRSVNGGHGIDDRCSAHFDVRNAEFMEVQ